MQYEEVMFVMVGPTSFNYRENIITKQPCLPITGRENT